MVRVRDFNFEHVQTIDQGRQLRFTFLRNEARDDEPNTIVIYYDIQKQQFYGSLSSETDLKSLSKTDVKRFVKAANVIDILKKYALRK